MSDASQPRRADSPLLTPGQLAALRKRLPNHKCPLGDEIARLYDKETAKALFNDEQFMLGARFLVVGANAILSEPGVFGEPLLAATINRALNTALHDLAQGRVESRKADRRRAQP
jgi:hypothetical protein